MPSSFLLLFPCTIVSDALQIFTEPGSHPRRPRLGNREQQFENDFLELPVTFRKLADAHGTLASHDTVRRKLSCICYKSSIKCRSTKEMHGIFSNSCRLGLRMVGETRCFTRDSSDGHQKV